MPYTTIVVLVALLEYIVFMLAVGRARGTYGIKAPAVTGHEVFERYYRVQQNTIEQLVVFLPAVFAFAHLVGDRWAAGIGAVFVVGRLIYFRAYVADPRRRGPGALLTLLANVVLVAGALIGAVRSLL